MHDLARGWHKWCGGYREVQDESLVRSKNLCSLRGVNVEGVGWGDIGRLWFLRSVWGRAADFF